MHSQKQIIMIIFGKGVSPDKKQVLTFLFLSFTPAHSFPFILPPLFFFLFYSSPLDCSLSLSFSLLNREKSCLLWLKVEMMPLKFIKITHSRTHPLTHPPAHALTRSLIVFISHSITHSFTHSLTCPLA